MSVHQKQKPFKCKICEKEFGQESDLKRHIMAEHEKQKPFKCTVCQKDF
jgi:zinc finger protein MSN2/4